jgi:hypothetical protein
MAFSRDEIVEKVKKLLKLAESSNINDRFEIEAASLQAESPTKQIREPIEEFSDFETGGRIENWRHVLLHVLCETNSCKTFKRRRDGLSKLFVIGRNVDVQTVRYMYRAMANIVESLSAMQQGRGRGYIASYKVGASSAICAKITESKEQTKKAIYLEASQIGTQALIRVDNAVAARKRRDTDLSAHMDALNLNLKKGGQTRISSNNGFNQGYADGQRANIGDKSRQLGN